MSDVEKITELLGALRSGLAERESVELDNLASDLRALQKRLLAGEYKEANFEKRNVFDVQRRTREYLTYFAGWNRQAERWAQILEAVGVRNVTEVIDLCPGWAPKIELALMKVGFQGRVRLVDKNPESMSALMDFLKTLAPTYQLEAVNADLFETPAVTGPLVVANHILDDVVLDLWAPKLGIDRSKLYDDEHELILGWRQIFKHSDKIIEEMAPAIASALASHVAPGGQLVLTHYVSHAEQILRANDAAEFFSNLFDRTVAALQDQHGLTPTSLHLQVFEKVTVASLHRLPDAMFQP